MRNYRRWALFLLAASLISSGATTAFAQDNDLNSKVVKISARVRQEMAGQKLARAIQLRQDIRQFLFDNGTRITKDQVASLDGSMSGWGILLFGIGGGAANGNVHGEAYENVLRGGELFMFNVLSDNAVKFVSEVSAKRRQGREWAACTATLYTKLAQPLDNRRKLDDLRGKLKDLQQTLNALEPIMVQSGPTAVQASAFQDLKTWATGSLIRLNWIDVPAYKLIWRSEDTSIWNDLADERNPKAHFGAQFAPSEFNTCYRDKDSLENGSIVTIGIEGLRVY